MIGRLVGTVVEDAEGTVVLDVRGVGYEVLVPAGTIGRIAGLRDPASGSAADAVTLFVHTHVREDAFLLYGFASRDERAVFRQLIGVSNIGPEDRPEHPRLPARWASWRRRSPAARRPSSPRCPASARRPRSASCSS